MKAAAVAAARGHRIQEECRLHTCVRIAKDSLTSWERLRSMQVATSLNSRTEENIMNSLQELGDKDVEVMVLWCPSHCGVWGNERADRLAAEEASKDQNQINWTFETARAVIKRRTTTRRVHSDGRAAVYGDERGNTTFPRDKGMSRGEQVTLCRLRSERRHSAGSQN